MTANNTIIEINSFLKMLTECNCIQHLHEDEIALLKFKLALIAKTAINDFSRSVSFMNHEMQNDITHSLLK